MGAEQWITAARRARAQFGVLSLEQFREEFGITRSAVACALERGRIERLVQGTYRFPGSVCDWRQRAFAATLLGGPGSAVSHHTAAALYGLAGLEKSPPQLHLSMPHRRSIALPAPFVVHRPQHPFVVGTHQRIPTTSVVRTLVDLAGALDEEALEIALDDAQHRFKGFHSELERALAHLNPQYPGLATLRELVKVRRGQSTESTLEVRVWRALRKANLDPPRLQLEVHHAGHYVMRVDFAWPRQRIALHADSFLWHARRDAFDTDARQRSVLASIGWANVIVTRHSLRERTWLQLLERLLHERRPQLTFSL